MSDVSSLGGQSLKDLGPGAYLVSALPSSIVVLTLVVLWQSRLYPGASLITATDRRAVAPGIDSIATAVRGVTVAGGIALVISIVVVAVLLRPFQVRLVQVLEGYWTGRFSDGAELIAVEWHRRRRIRAETRLHPKERDSDSARFEHVLEQSRRRRRADRIIARAEDVRANYPKTSEDVMPTALGNILRRGETTAGERYGLSTVTTYPRLYPLLSQRVDSEIANQLNVLDTSATFVVVFSVLGTISSPLLLRVDPWSFVPVVLIITAVVSYRGALAAAARYAELLSAAYDLHRFDLLKALRRALPVTGVDEVASNRALSDFLASDAEIAGSDVAHDRYEHKNGAAARSKDLRAPGRR